MAYFFTEQDAGWQPIANTETTQLHRLGTIRRAFDSTYGEGEFIYLKGVASTIAGSVVTWGGGGATPTYQTVLAPATAGLGQSLAVAMSANVAGQFGWYQVGGHAVVATNGTLGGADVAIFLVGSGQVTSTASVGKQVLNARSNTATGTPAANQAVIALNRPFAQGQIT